MLNNLNHEALLLVDCIASLACDEFHMDDWGVDVMVAACQKGIMVPPGVSFVFFNQKAKDRQNLLKWWRLIGTGSSHKSRLLL